VSPTTAEAAAAVQRVERLATDVAFALSAQVELVLEDQETCHLMLSGGSTGTALARALAEPLLASRLPWSRLHLWLADERSVPPAHPDSNWGNLERALLTRLPAPPAGQHRPAGEQRPLAPAAAAYEAELRRAVPGTTAGRPRVDLLLLGLGADGHTASLFPGTPALEEEERLFVANPVPALGTTRLTITYPLIATAREVWFVVGGPGKGAALRRVHGQEPGAELPAARVVRLATKVRWWLDPVAAAELAG